MKHSLSPLYIAAGALGVCALIFFALTAPVADAQARLDLRPAQEFVETRATAQDPERQKDLEVRDTKALRETSTRAEVERAQNARVHAAEEAPRSFLERARETLLERRNQDAGSREDAANRRLAAQEENKDARIQRYLDKVERKMAAAVGRLETLGARIESRIAKLEARGLDMTESKRLLETAKENIEEARENIRLALEEAKTALETGVTREAFGVVVSTLAQAKEHLRDAHQALVQTIRSMKAGIADETADTDTNEAPTEN